jgi:hypothetical protein
MKYRVTVRQYVQKLRPTPAGYRGYVEKQIDVNADGAPGAGEAALDVFNNPPRIAGSRWHRPASRSKWRMF